MITTVIDLEPKRLASGMTQERAAESAQLDSKTIQRAESHSKSIGFRAIRKLTSLFGELTVRSDEGTFRIARVLPERQSAQPSLDDVHLAIQIIARFIGNCTATPQELGYVFYEIQGESRDLGRIMEDTREMRQLFATAELEEREKPFLHELCRLFQRVVAACCTYFDLHPAEIGRELSGANEKRAPEVSLGKPA